MSATLSLYTYIEFNTGLDSDTIQGEPGEPYYATDTNILYIGNGEGVNSTAINKSGSGSKYNYISGSSSTYLSSSSPINEIDTSVNPQNIYLSSSISDIGTTFKIYHTAHETGNNLTISCLGSYTFDGSNTTAISSTTGDFMLITMLNHIQFIEIQTPGFMLT